MLLSLLPSGLAWPKEQGTELYTTVEAFAQELERIDARSWELISESDPRTTFDMIADWERVLGLPDECAGQAQTLQGRRNEILSKLTSSGSINRQFYIDLAQSLGFEITITEFRPFRAGLSVAGDALTNGDWIYAWRVNAPDNTITYFRSGMSAAGEPLAVWGNDILECVIKNKAPAGTIVLFGYGG